MLRYIVSHLRERALVSDCQYISATIFDGLNNLKREKVLFRGRKKGKAQKKEAPLGPPHPLYPPLLLDMTEGNN